MTDSEFQRHALSILQRELGAEGFARFLHVYRSGHGDYTKERDHILKSATIDDIVEQVRSANRQNPMKQ
ncbi:MAG: hypothetical protein JO145_07230 [Acidobacteriaceae bacterium]|nr:hypothetical protein [Acidobacteriaceae bacterium]